MWSWVSTFELDRALGVHKRKATHSVGYNALLFRTRWGLVVIDNLVTPLRPSRTGRTGRPEVAGAIPLLYRWVLPMLITRG